MISLALLVFGYVGGPRCVNDYGQTICGYHCVAAYGQVECAQTPAGACRADYGKIVCWDPPLALSPWTEEPLYSYPPLPHAECVAAFGEIACGYNCRTAYGQLRCAQTSAGVCDAAYGQIVCWDSPEAIGNPYAASWPPAECVSAFGQIQCGYGCVSALGQIACGQTPASRCFNQNGVLECWDPAPDSAPGEGGGEGDGDDQGDDGQ